MIRQDRHDLGGRFLAIVRKRHDLGGRFRAIVRKRPPRSSRPACTALAVALVTFLPESAAAQGAAAASHDQHQTAGDQGDYPSLKITGFGDIDFSATRHPEGAQGFSEGQLTLHMASALSPHTTFFGEVTFTPRTDAGMGTPPAPGFNAEVERMIIRFDRNDKLKVSFGRYHTPINWWNTAFHHGQWLQTTITRPEMIQFGGKLLPVHFVGALVEGAIPAGGLNLNYQAGIGNGRSSVLSRAGDAGDINGSRAVLFTGFIRPDRAYALQTGGSIYADTITLASGGTFQERIYSGHIVWTREDPELIAEFAAIRHAPIGVSTPNWTRAFYAQAAYRLPQLNRLWKPYVRFEHIGVNLADAVFAGVPSLDMTTIGVRYDLSALAAVKTEYRTWTRGAGTVRNQGGFMQICFTF